MKTEAKIYVGTYAKYNNGSIEGRWLVLSDYSDKEEFYEACRKLHADEADPEFMFQDWEHIPENLIGESWLSNNFFAIRNAMGALGKDEQEAFLVWCDNGSYDIAAEDASYLISTFRDEFQGKYDSEEDFARTLVEESYGLSEFAKEYFDYEKYARERLFKADYWFEDGFVFLA